MASRSFFKKSIQGFTLIELMVALFIMSLATVLLLANYPDSTIRMTLLNSTHSLAIQIREAQIRGSAIDSAGDGSVGGFGVFIDSEQASKSILFSDSSKGFTLKNGAGLSIGDGLYATSTSPDVAKSVLLLKERFTFGKLCVSSTTATLPDVRAPYGYFCDSDYSLPIKTLTVSFMRPNQTAHIYINNSTSTDFPSACVQLFSPKTPSPGHVRSVEIFHSGVLTTKATPCN